ncbi:uncharacterized protein BDV14DRAFT_178579 [Aspergillus stella-maris]|uniref:uncharacterized protein n=1 Tax=Aspergillus stella-maris TaxID=1810926 RepID=UPI003CCE413D
MMIGGQRRSKTKKTKSTHAFKNGTGILLYISVFYIVSCVGVTIRKLVRACNIYPGNMKVYY